MRVDLYRQALVAWRDWSTDARHGICEDCGRHRDENGKLLIVRRARRSRWLCLECWDQGAR